MSSIADATFHGDLVTSKRNIYTPAAFARENLLYLQEAGSLRAAKPHTSRRSGLASYLFFMVTAGSGTLRLQPQGDGSRRKAPQPDRKAYVSTLRPGDCVFLDCRQSYSHTTSNDLWALKWVHFNGKQMDGIYRKFLERSGGPVFHPAGDNTISWQLDRIYNISISDSYVRDMQINEALASLLTSVMAYSWNPEAAGYAGSRSADSGPADIAQDRQAPPEPFRISDVRDYIDTHYAEEFTLDDLAGQFHFNKYYLMRLFRARYGTTIINYRIHVRISTAKKLLRFSSLSLEETGARVGMKDANYFSRMFRKVEGITPGEYRRQW